VSSTMVSVELDDLYGVPMDRFVPERAALVRALRSAGEREQAASVAALRKPSVAAWAVNQLVRTRRAEVDGLLRAGDALREAQAGVLSGGADARDLRSAADEERRAVSDLVDTARGLLSSSGQELSATTLERVADTLHAAALDDDARGQVSDGRLVRELRHVGLGAGLGDAFAAAPAQARPARPAKGEAATQRGAAKGETAKQRRSAEAAQREREAARKQARAAERDAAREVDRAERALRVAEDRRDRAAEALRQADDAAAEAQAGREAAIAAHRQAQQQLDSL
jgi:hypothetical protein